MVKRVIDRHMFYLFKPPLGGWGHVIKEFIVIFFEFIKIIPIFVPTNQIILPVKGVWFLLRRAERLGSAKPWQPILKILDNGAKT